MCNPCTLKDDRKYFYTAFVTLFPIFFSSRQAVRMLTFRPVALFFASYSIHCVRHNNTCMVCVLYSTVPHMQATVCVLDIFTGKNFGQHSYKSSRDVSVDRVNILYSIAPVRTPCPGPAPAKDTASLSPGKADIQNLSMRDFSCLLPTQIVCACCGTPLGPGEKTI